MKKEGQPLAEVFGHPPTDFSAKANHYRTRKLCPFNNKIPNCNKDKADDPLGVCSIHHQGAPAIICPTRFREDWLITDDAAEFFFPTGTPWTKLTEVRLKDYDGRSAGNIDIVLVAYDEEGIVVDFGALEIQAVYISGNVREPFRHYISNPCGNASMDWTGQRKYPRPDYLSSSRKRLAPQLLFKGGILNAWNKKIAVALNKGFFDTLPNLKRVSKDEAEIAWLIYDLIPEQGSKGAIKKYVLRKVDTVYTRFQSALDRITKPHPGELNKFIRLLQDKIDDK